ncbi:Hypothetical predicted protein [Lynx pardinus]|uniref:Uncharacterized protein n=1 Tax=Lynx pardinus TaxID=191816 RepID=A0A485PKY1_LYNPA|nr:Hypothetical predicted protein [Lynx pardinus]
MDDIPEETDGVLSSVAQKRELHDEAKDRDRIQDTLNSNLCLSSGDGSKLQQEMLVCPSNKAIEDLSLQSNPRVPFALRKAC